MCLIFDYRRRFNFLSNFDFIIVQAEFVAHQFKLTQLEFRRWLRCGCLLFFEGLQIQLLERRFKRLVFSQFCGKLGGGRFIWR